MKVWFLCKFHNLIALKKIKLFACKIFSSPPYNFGLFWAWTESLKFFLDILTSPVKIFGVCFVLKHILANIT